MFVLEFTCVFRPLPDNSMVTRLFSQGYFQLKASPGLWRLRLREGRSQELYTIQRFVITDKTSLWNHYISKYYCPCILELWSFLRSSCVYRLHCRISLLQVSCLICLISVFFFSCSFSHEFTDTPAGSSDVVVAMNSFKSKIIRIKVYFIA